MGLETDPLELIARSGADTIRNIRLLLPAVLDVGRGAGSEVASLQRQKGHYTLAGTLDPFASNLLHVHTGYSPTTGPFGEY